MQFNSLEDLDRGETITKSLVLKIMMTEDACSKNSPWSQRAGHDLNQLKNSIFNPSTPTSSHLYLHTHMNMIELRK